MSEPSQRFAGVPEGRVAVTPLPNVLFSELFPAVDDLDELRVTLHVLYLWHQNKRRPQHGRAPVVTLAALRADATLRRAVSPEAALDAALAKAVQRGSLLAYVEDGQRVFALNTPEARRAAAQAESPDGAVRERTPAPAEVPRPSVFQLYEQNIGLLTPMIAEELQEAEKEYPPEWIMDAFRIAVENNVRKWAYVRKILESWAREGKDETIGRDSKKGRTWFTPEERKFFKR